ncbi:uncharacterized protein FOMMEDRAFT_139425 [Fomitiporia mediterranea MF3/22]|uniref:uncharacterized protein n=1 Tax=Fomitiporia mediterranea (strain MF3/22) TaxID=694068 RepID=UPI0004407D7B|nr:uncharacterized protein FOMMEDRAFT_139425 [Fomitiporia mediterranea MF3/22]EJD06211.1 hypothetical protein FOMMEDRAFT_139425 [Fomitiporia mediterranea MF3/22]
MADILARRMNTQRTPKPVRRFGSGDRRETSPISLTPLSQSVRLRLSSGAAICSLTRLFPSRRNRQSSIRTSVALI